MVAQVLSGGEEVDWTLLLTLPAAVCGMVAAYNTYHAHASVIGDFEGELTDKWERLWKWEIGTLGITFGVVLLAVIAPLLGLLAMLAGLIGSVVVSILSMVYLYRTAQACRWIAATYQAEA